MDVLLFVSVDWVDIGVSVARGCVRIEGVAGRCG